MNKLAIVFFAALAFQASLARPHTQQQQTREVQDLLAQIRSIASQSIKSVEGIQLETDMLKNSLYAQSHEYAHDIHEVVHHLNLAIYSNEGGQSQTVLQEVAQRLGSIVFAVQQALHSAPSYLKTQLQAHIQTALEEAEKLAEVAQQQLQTRDVNDEIQDILDDLFMTIQKIYFHNEVIEKTEQEVTSQIQAVTNQVSSAIQKVRSNEVETVDDLVHFSHHLAYHLGEVVHQLQREVQHNDGDVKNVMEQVLNKLTEVRAALDQAHKDTKVSELKDQLRTNVHSVAVQIDRLVQLAHSDSLNEHETRNVRNAVRLVVVDVVVAEKQLQRNLEFVLRNSQQY